MKKYLLDTSVIIDFLRRKDKEDSLLFRLAEEDLSISIITHTELYAGRSVWERKDAMKELEDLFSDMTVLPLQQDVSKRAGSIKAQHPRINLLDCIVAASAIVHNLSLVTLNMKDFEPIQEIKLYRGNSGK